MFFKLIYNNLFSVSSYKENKNKSLVYSIVYTLLLTIVFGFIFSWMGYYKVKPYLDSQIKDIYDKVPDFSLSSEGLEIEGEDSYCINFAGVELYIDDSKTFLEMAVEDGLDVEGRRTYIGKDGFGIIEGSNLKDAEYFKNTALLENQVLKKDDFRIIYETIRLMSNDIVLLIFLLLIIIFILVVFIKNIFYAIVLKLILKIRQKEITYKDSYKLSLFSQTFYIIYFGVILFSNMNLIIPIKIMIIEIISLIYIFLVGFNYSVDNRGKKREGNKKKKRRK